MTSIAFIAMVVLLNLGIMIKITVSKIKLSCKKRKMTKVIKQRKLR